MKTKLTIKKKEKIKIFDDILNAPFGKKMCANCGNYQSHSLIYCGCGEKFIGENLTVLDSLRIAKNRRQQYRPIQHKPYFLACIWSRKLREIGIEDYRELENYINKKLL